MWQCFFVTARGRDNGEFVHMDDQQGEALQRWGAEGWELVGTTVLTNGWLHLAFKRFVPVETPAPAVPNNQYL